MPSITSRSEAFADAYRLAIGTFGSALIPSRVRLPLAGLDTAPVVVDPRPAVRVNNLRTYAA
jgi:hypothetical protein